jgi:hypothetical protein
MIAAAGLIGASILPTVKSFDEGITTLDYGWPFTLVSCTQQDGYAPKWYFSYGLNSGGAIWQYVHKQQWQRLVMLWLLELVTWITLVGMIALVSESLLRRREGRKP